MLRYNISPDCVLMHHGVSPTFRGERVRLMRPLADGVVEQLAATFDGVSFSARAAEFDGTRLFRMEPPSEGLSERERKEIPRFVGQLVPNYLFELPLPLESLRSMPESDAATFAVLNGLQVHDPLRLVMMIDEVLLTVDGVRRFSGMWDVVAVGTPELRGPDGDDHAGHCAFLPGECGGFIGLAMSIRLPSTLGLIVHEASHIVNMVDGVPPDEDHGPPFVSALSEVIRAVVESGCYERVRSTLSVTPPEFPVCVHASDIVDGGRWMARFTGRSVVATWRPDSASLWGQGTTDSELVISGLKEPIRGFVMRTLAR